MTRPGEQDATRGRGAPSRGQEVSRYEWLAAVFGAVVVLASVGFLLYDALAVPTSAPDVAIEVDSIVETSGGYLVEFRAINAGHSTAAALVVRGELRDGAETVETSEATLDYLPEGASRAGGVFFREDPRRHRLVLHPRSYARP